MRDEDKDFPEILEEAKSPGYADPASTFDVEGIDAAHKFTILASIASGKSSPEIRKIGSLTWLFSLMHY